MTKHDDLRRYCKAKDYTMVRMSPRGSNDSNVARIDTDFPDDCKLALLGKTPQETSRLVSEWLAEFEGRALPAEAFHPAFVPPKSLDDAYDGIEQVGDMVMDDSAAVSMPIVSDETLNRMKELSDLGITDSRYTPANVKKYPHYFMPVGNATHIDLHDICDWLGVSSVIGHAIKKLACAGKRGAKSEKQDLLEAINCIIRRIEVLDNLK